MTDVTGFGLMGHARELAMGSGVRLKIDTGSIQMLEGAVEAIRLGCIPGGLIANREYAECVVEDEQGAGIPDAVRTVLYDPQTAGGLLISVVQEHADALVKDLRGAGYAAAGQIGVVLDGSPKIVLG